MFYDHVFTPDEKQVLLHLAESHFLIKVDCPEFLKRSKHAIEIRHTVTNRTYGQTRRTGNIITTFVPRIHMSEVNRLVKTLRESPTKRAAENLGNLFDLGLGVPKQRDVARYLKSYSPEDDPKGIGLKYIRKLIVNYHRNYRRCMAGSRWCMPAAYVANMLHMQSLIHLKENGYKKKLSVPDGVPVVLIYYNKNHADGEFALCDAFMISPLGYPVPFAQIAMRNEFKAAPKTFVSKSLAGQGVYSMVLGMLHWPKQDSVDNVRQLMDLDADSYLSMLDMDKYAHLRSARYAELLAERDADAETRVEMSAIIDRLGSKRDLKPKQEEKLNAAHEYFAQRTKFLKAFDEFEKKEAHKAAPNFAVAQAQFAAIDCGTIMDRKTYLPVKTELDKVQYILGKWGFSTVNSVNASLKKSVLTYTDKKLRRWSL